MLIYDVTYGSGDNLRPPDMGGPNPYTGGPRPYVAPKPPVVRNKSALTSPALPAATFNPKVPTGYSGGSITY